MTCFGGLSQNQNQNTQKPGDRESCYMQVSFASGKHKGPSIENEKPIRN